MSQTGSQWLVGGLLGMVVPCLAMAAVPAADSPPQTVQFTRDIRPILSDNCFRCHGPDEEYREADLRLDTRQGAFADLGGYRALVAGDPEESELFARITDADEDSQMPPPDSDRKLTPEQIETVRLWIQQGASWQDHWSFVPPKRPQPRKVSRANWPRNPIDNFILARLDAEGLQPSPEANPVTLLRRVALDLTGLPPTTAEVDAFLADQSPGAYEKAVDRLLASPRYGEHMTRDWLDLARYGDTHGLHLDNQRSMWLYRDWLIGAFNENKRFDQFTIEQLAGDLLPEPTLEQRVATGFNRCNVTTSEGGSIAEEYVVRYAVDRTDTTATVWMGLTVGCASCHDHKFDPITQKEFYRLYAFFNSTTEKAMDGNALLPPPVLKVPSREQAAQRKSYTEQIADVDTRIQAALATIDYQEPPGTLAETSPQPVEVVWIEDSLPPGAQPEGDGQPPWQFVAAPSHPVHSGTKSSLRSAAGRTQHFFTGASPGLKIAADDKLFAYVFLDPDNPPKEIMLQFNDGTWEHRAFWGADLIDWGQAGTPSRFQAGPLPEKGKWVRLEVEAAQVGLAPGAILNGWACTQFDGTVHWDKSGIVTLGSQDARRFESLAAWLEHQRALKKSPLPGPLQAALKIEADKRTDAQKKQLRDYFLQHAYANSREVFEPLHRQREELKKKADALEKAIPATMVTAEMAKPRETFVLKRGDYDKPGEKVTRGVPAVLPPMPKGAPANRLGLARWLVDPGHPLTARVTVNRFWQHYFGTGLVKTSEDFGAQGEWPSHPALLDWLAVEFVQSGWDVKHMQRLIVTSATYRQSSRVTPELLAKDPHNRLLARGPRFRIDAEMVRDNALAISGLLVERIGGPSVKPYQPPGLWQAVGYSSSNTARFKVDQGDALYRRSMYTFWKRTSPPPTMSLLDAPSRETCTARRARTNTPLAALALLNDTQYVEAARALAGRMMTEGGKTPQQRVEYALRRAVARTPAADEVSLLVDEYQVQLERYKKDAGSAKSLISVGDSRPNTALDPAELAAWTIVASVILNLDETVTKM